MQARSFALIAVTAALVGCRQSEPVAAANVAPVATAAPIAPAPVEASNSAASNRAEEAGERAEQIDHALASEAPLPDKPPGFWKGYGEEFDSDGRPTSTDYFSMDIDHETGSVRRAWMRQNFSGYMKLPFKSDQYEVEIDCDGARMRTLAWTSYSRENGWGEVVSTLPSDDWHYIPSSMQRFTDLACTDGPQRLDSPF